ncbi:hypothetical protein EB001_13410 [bacterium]|nr:hypothetical protein [bacterium]
MTTKLSEIDYNGYVVQIHYNPSLKTQPYLIRIYSWDNDPYEIRLEKVELKELSHLIDSSIGEKL